MGDNMSIHQQERPPPYLQESKIPELPSVLFQNASNGVHSTQSALKGLPSTRAPYSHPFITKVIKVEPTKTAQLQNQQPARGIALSPYDFPQVPKIEPGELSSHESMMDIDEPPRRRDTSVSMDDPDDRMAVEALCGLGKVGASQLSAGKRVVRY